MIAQGLFGNFFVLYLRVFLLKRPWENVISDLNTLLDKLVMPGIIVLILNE